MVHYMECSEAKLAKPFNSKEYKLITIKDNSGQLTKDDLLYVNLFIASVIGYDATNSIKQVFETGDQNRLHLHFIAKKKDVDELSLKKYSQNINNKKFCYKYEIVKAGEITNDPALIKVAIPLKSITWHFQPFKDQSHFNYVFYEYLDKELLKNVDFKD